MFLAFRVAIFLCILLYISFFDLLCDCPLQLLKDEFSLANVLAMLIVDTFLYGILTWYIEHVFPGAYGLPKAWYFPFQMSYWLGDKSRYCAGERSRSELYSRMSSIDGESPPGLLAVDADPVHIPLGVVIDNLTKVRVSENLAIPFIEIVILMNFSRMACKIVTYFQPSNFEHSMLKQSIMSTVKASTDRDVTGQAQAVLYLHALCRVLSNLGSRARRLAKLNFDLSFFEAHTCCSFNQAILKVYEPF